MLSKINVRQYVLTNRFHIVVIIRLSSSLFLDGHVDYQGMKHCLLHIREKEIRHEMSILDFALLLWMNVTSIGCIRS
jgi:hypothetical protein